MYSFGVADDWTFDKLMGGFGCEVHSFDPTVELPEEAPLAPNVTSHQRGLKGRTTTREIAAEAESHYGHQAGPLYTLQEIRQLLNHKGELCVLKMDCEGCEWDFFAAFREQPTVLPDQLAIDFHFRKSYGINTATDFRIYQQLLAEADYERFFWQDNAGYPWTRNVSEIAVKAGFPPGSWCPAVERWFLAAYKST